jgi:NADP-dependent 3-hydroxy acid dehydrogenase YdfG
MARLANKVALITGGGSGVGLATARMFLAEGAQVAIAGRDRDKLLVAADSLQAPDRVSHHPADVSDPEQATALAEAVTARWGRVDVLVNNAGANIKARTFRELTPEAWQKLIRTNLDGAFYVTHAVMPAMLARKDGVVIFINSVSGLRANPLGGAAYNASKFGLTGLATSLAAEEKDSGVRVTGIFPGEINTPILDERPTPVSAEHRSRILQPEDVAASVLFVATLPPHVHIPELVIKPAHQAFI